MASQAIVQPKFTFLDVIARGRGNDTKSKGNLTAKAKADPWERLKPVSEAGEASHPHFAGRSR